MSAPMPPRERLPGLDVLRGLAAVAVMAFHFSTRFGGIFGHPAALAFYVPWGQRGVEVFFVISGFAIELSLESTSSAREFLWSRAVRLYPTFWAALAVTLAVVGIFGLPERVISFQSALLNVTMIPVSLGAAAADAVYWTLERELRFYGLVLLLLALGLRRYTVHALLATVLLQTFGANATWIPHWLSDLTNFGWAHLFASGMLLARARRNASLQMYALVALCLMASRALGFTQFAYSSAAVALVWLATRASVHGALTHALAWLGRISYPLYLVHQYVGYVVMRALYARGASPGVAIACASAVVLGLALALHFLVERRSLDVIRRMRGRKPQRDSLERAGFDSGPHPPEQSARSLQRARSSAG
ncbi:MAG TPA: acyltransferase [Polyangiaceae bacterium]|nr:acyltransferase [Polyangiaceae bacterium]